MAAIAAPDGRTLPANRALKVACGWPEGDEAPRFWIAVNPSHRELDGAKVSARCSDLPAPADLAVVCVPPAAVVDTVAELFGFVLEPSREHEVLRFALSLAPMSAEAV
jgi:hypothetical protein